MTIEIYVNECRRFGIHFGPDRYVTLWHRRRDAWVIWYQFFSRRERL